MKESLLHKISSEKKLLEAWGKLNKSNKSSYGIDNISIEDFGANIDDKISSISKKLREGSYRFSKNRAVLIPKSNGKFRPLQVPTISDRLVLKAIAIELESQFEKTIKQSDGLSFAYQKKLGVKNAIDKIKEHYDNGNTVVLEADLVNFFGEVDKEKLLKTQIFPQLPDESLNDLINSALNQEIGGLDKIKEHQKKYFEGLNTGIPQGNPLSPLLSNIYLSPFDLYLKDKGYLLVRYADDFIILCKNAEDCEKAYKDCLSILTKLDLKIHPLEEGDKTKVIDLSSSTFDFLSITFDGQSFYPSIENIERLKSKIRDICNGKVEYNVLSLLNKTFNVFDGWVSAFYYTDVERYSEEIDYYINRQLFLALRKFDWKFTPSTKGTLPNKYRNNRQSADCLSDIQRQKSGIPNCNELLVEKRRKKNDT
ncbi:reverse transcriptase domain-containing protein [Flagellimonas sp.]|uniref:reverse transcriptase domain-containing protein n=1 Tax=Flagellimonas sp. TaxID=2058762 RepID=UPI003BA8ABFF